MCQKFTQMLLYSSVYGHAGCISGSFSAQFFFIMFITRGGRKEGTFSLTYTTQGN